jgi:hypothetical protein
MRNGDFSALLPARAIRDPVTGLPFQNNQIPQDRISPNGRALLNAFPLPTPGFQQGANNWIGAPSFFNNQRKDSIKIDFVPVPDHRISVRHTWAPNIWNDPEPFGTFATVWDYPGRTLAATLSSTLSNSLINEFTFSWGSTEAGQLLRPATCAKCPATRRSELPATNSQIGLAYPYLFPGYEDGPGEDPEHLAAGISRDQQQRLPGRVERLRLRVPRHVTKIPGNHTFKAGLSIERSGMNDQIQLSFATGPGHGQPERVVPLLRHPRRPAPGTRWPNTAASAVRRLHGVGAKPAHALAGVGH